VPDDALERARETLAQERTDTGRRRYREVMVSDAPPPLTPYLARGVVDAVFAELWDRPGLSRRDRRFITIACVGAAAVDVPIQQHVYAALASGDVSREEMQEIVLHFAYYSGWPRASALEAAYYQAVARLDAEAPGGASTASGGGPEASQAEPTP
jgi:4-carboxymuconolactone decarboxylase